MSDTMPQGELRDQMQREVLTPTDDLAHMEAVRIVAKIERQLASAIRDAERRGAMQAINDLIAAVNAKGQSWRIETNPGYDAGHEYYVTIRDNARAVCVQGEDDDLIAAIRAALRQWEAAK